MTLVRVDNKGFSTGAVSASIETNDNLVSHQRACREATNYQCLTSGRARKRTGAKYAGTVANAIRMVPYQVTLDLSFGLCFASGSITIFDSDVPLAYTVPHDLTEEQVVGMQYSQYRNFLVLTGKTFHPKVFFLNPSTDVFEYQDYVFLNGATRDENVNNNIAIRSDVYQEIGSVATLTATNAVFLPGMEGGVWGLTEPYGTLGIYTEWAVNVTVPLNAYRRHEGRVYQALTGGVTSIPPTHDRPGEVLQDGNVQWLFLNRGIGYLRLTEIVSGTVARGSIQQSLPPTITDIRTNPNIATTRWNEGAFSEYRGYPSSVTFFSGRSVFAKGNRLEGSKVGDVFNFDTGASTPTDALSLELASDRASAISWLLSTDKLLVGSQSGIFPIDSISPAGISGSRNIADVTSDTIKAVFLNNRAFYMDFSRGVLKTTMFNETQDSFLSQSLSIDSEEFVFDVLELHGGQADYNKVYMLRGDGRVVVQQFDVMREILGVYWLEFSRGVDSMCVLQARDFERVYILAGEVVGLWGNRSYPYLDFWQDADAPKDITIWNGAQVTMAAQSPDGVNSLEKKYQNFDGDDPPIFPVLPAGLTGYLGEPYEAELTLLRPSSSGGGQKFGFPIVTARLTEVHVAYEDTQELRVNGKDSLVTRIPLDLMDAAPPKRTGVARASVNFDISKSVVFSSVEPLSCTVLFYSIIYESP